jgi:hypothetical protein
MLFAAVGQCSCMAILAGTTSVTHKATGIIAATMLFLFKSVPCARYGMALIMQLFLRRRAPRHSLVAAIRVCPVADQSVRGGSRFGFKLDRECRG